jgi:flagellar motor switch protein FliM
MPFLSRYKSQLVPGPVRSFQSSNEGDLAPPTFSMAIGTPDGLGWGSVTLDAHAIGLILEGALGGSGPFWEAPLDATLTAAQRALLTRVTRSLATELADQIRRKVGLAMNVLEVASGAPATAPDAGDLLRVSCAIEGLPVPAAVLVAASAQALEHAAKEHDEPEPAQGDPRIIDALLDVPIEVRAELGRVSLGLRRVLALVPGDVIHLRTATDDPLQVTTAGVAKFAGVPVVSRGQLSIEIRERHRT